MEENIFNGAKFGDRFVTKNGKIAVYINNDAKRFHYLGMEPCTVSGTKIDTVRYLASGKVDTGYRDSLDIISRYKEPLKGSMKNIFKGAVFADRFRTRDGRRALYLYGTTLWVDGNENETTYSPDGSFGYRNGLGNLDIVSKEEPPYSQCNALNLIHYLDEHCYEGKMCFSNMECADLEKAFDSGDWAKVIRYINKYLYK